MTTSINNIKVQTKNMDAKYYIAYGANMPTDAMATRTPDARVVGTGMIKDYRLVFNGCATVVPSEGDYVPVVIWTISSSDEKKLDYFEGYPSYYRKEFMDITLPDGTTGTGMIYIMNSPYYQVEKPSNDYYMTLERGYKEHGLPMEILETALNDSNRKYRDYTDYGSTDFAL